MKEIEFTKHALKQISDRGVNVDEVKDVIYSSRRIDAKYSRHEAQKVFEFNKIWEGVFYSKKEVRVIFKEENDKMIVITAISRFFEN